MKRLFTVNGEHFATKLEAKAARGPKIPDKLGEGFHYAHTISKGPDHDGNHGHSVPSTRFRGPRDAAGHRNTPPDLAARARKAADKK